MLRDIRGKCEDIHGHNFTVEVSVASKDLNREGMLIDFRVLKGWTEEALRELDHKFLNDLPYFKNKNPSSENIARFIYDMICEKVKLQGIAVSRITVGETENTKISCNGE
jgi:6-pyruvoyl-tetrahydropterin synthase